MSERSRVGIVDAAFLDCETPRTPMHVGGVMLFDGHPEIAGRPGAAGLVDAIAERLPLLPRLRQRLQSVPLGMGDPVWVDDAGFDLHRHVRRQTLTAPGTERLLWETVAALHSRPLDRRHPLWELHLVDGLAGGRSAVYVKLHHAMVDGLAAVQLGLVLLDADPGGGMSIADELPPASAQPLGSELFADALRERFDAAAGAVREGLTALRDNPAGLAQNLWTGLRSEGLRTALSTLSRPAPRTPFNPAEVGGRRRIAAVKLSLTAAKEVKNAFGATVNDVVLATVAEALHTFLRHRGESVAGLTCRVLVPVAVRSGEAALAMGNGLSGMVVDLPVGPLAPALRLRAISRRVGALKVGRQAATTERLVSFASFAPPRLRSAGLRAALGRQRLINLVVSNVPGVQVPLYAGGARLREVYPLLPLGPNLGLSICVLSYADTLHVGLVADAAAFPDLDVLAAALPRGLASLQRAARD